MDTDIHSPQRIARLTPLDDVLRMIGQIRPVAPREVELQDALGRVLAEDVAARAAHPPTAIALRDGFAVQSDITADASAYSPIPLAQNPQRLDAGETIPPNADAIAPLDGIVVAGGTAQAIAPVTAGDGILPVGADANAGTPLRKAGQRLRSSDVAALTVCDVERAKIREPRILLVRAGANEKAEPSVTLIARAIEHAGGRVARSGNFEQSLTQDDCDAIFAIGGTGTGRDDTAVETLKKLGQMSVHGIALMPGNTAAFGFADECPVLLLPGRLDAAWSVWLAIGRPLLSRLSGETDEAPSFPAALSRKITSTIGIADLVLVRRDGNIIEPLASGYWPMQAIAKADGFIIVPAQSEGYAEGSIVAVRPLP
jgi:molybdopterin biosynthesis enzyme